MDEGYYRLEGVDPDQQFDLAVVDSSWRWLCLEHVLPRMKPGGIVYLDNADADKDLRSYPEPSHRRLAQRKLETYLAETPGASILKLRSLISGELHAGEGWIVQMPE